MEKFINVKLFIFDLDKTIANLQINWTEVKEKVRKTLKTNHALTPLIPSIEKLVSDSELKKRVYKVIDNEEMKVVKKLKVDEDIVKLFKNLKKLGYKIVLVTLQGYKPAIEALNRLNIYEYFDLVISRDEKKTREEQVKMALKTMGVQASQAIIVADKLMDLAVAKKLGCMSMAVTDKPNITGDFKAANIKEILKILEVD